MMTKGMYSSKTSEWATPHELFNELNKEFHFTLDPCATEENATCMKFFTKESDGLSRGWNEQVVFMNPPYGREIGKWVEKAFKKFHGHLLCCARTVVALLPARTDTAWFHDHLYGKTEIRFLRGRLKFNDGKNPAPFPSMIVIYRERKVAPAPDKGNQ